MSDLVKQIIEQTIAEGSHFLDLGNCGLRAIPEEVTTLPPSITAVNFGSGYRMDIQSSWSDSRNVGKNNDFSTNDASLGLLSYCTSLTGLHLYDCGIGDKGAAEIGKLKSLTNLDIWFNNVGDTGAAEIGKLQALTNLGISGNRIGDKGAAEIGKLTSLVNLAISDNEIGDKGAAEIGRLTSLTHLSISVNDIGDKGAAEIGKLTSLSSLDISDNNIRDMGAAGIGRLRSLTRLDIDLNEIGDMGAAEIGNLTSLTYLSIGYNEIGDNGAAEIGKLKSITNLFIGSNNIGAKGAAEIGNLTLLRYLSIGFNEIGDKGAAEIGKLKSLTNLYINSNNIGEKGAAEISKLGSLTTLNINDNNIGEKGAAEISKLGSLTTLNIKGNNIGEKGASEIGKLKSLTNLDINSNSIGDKGAAEIGELKSLTYLSISRNSIGEKGAAHIAKLKSLTYLNISSNSIGEKGAAEVGKLQALTKLDISSNNIGEKGAAEIGGLKSLTKLHIRSNSITEKGAAAIGKLTALTYLDIRSNSIGDMGVAEMGQLTNLSEMDSGDNGIIQARQLLRMSQLDYLQLRGNPIRDVPDHIVEQYNCIADLRAWDQELRTAEKVVQNDVVKLQVLGNGNAGKSSLVEALKMGRCAERFTSTHGIKVDVLQYEVEGEPVQFHYWDFGGQEIYHGTHRLFIASQAVHLLVADAESETLARERQRVGDRDRPEEMVLHQPLQHYIKTSTDLSPDSCRLVVQNKMDLPPMPLDPDLPSVAAKNSIECLSVSATTGEGITALQTKLGAMRHQVRHFGLPMPATWLAVQQYFIENRASAKVDRRRQMSVEKFNAVCMRHGVSAASAPALLAFLHHTGLVYRNENLMKDRIILDQEWALDAIYRPLERTSAFYAELRKELRGRVQVKRLFEAFGPEYDLDAKWLFLGFMQSCGLCFPINNNEQEETEESYYILPEFLPEAITPSAAKLWETVGSTETFEYRPAYLDYFTVQQFIVALGRKTSVEHIWRNGVVIGTPAGKIKVEADAKMNKLVATMEGGTVNRYLGALVRMFEEEEDWSRKERGSDWYDAEGKPLDVGRLQANDERRGHWPETEEASWAQGRHGEAGDNDLTTALPDVPQTAPKRLVISFASENIGHLESIKEALANYELDGTVQVLYDDKVIDGRAGWDQQIQELFATADGYLILASLPYQNVQKHPYIWEKEVPLMKRRHKEEGVFTFCVSVGPVKYNNELVDLPAYRNGKDVLPESGHARDKFLIEFAESVIENKFLKDDEH